MARPLTPAEEAALRKQFNIPVGQAVPTIYSQVLSEQTLADLVKRHAPIAPSNAGIAVAPPKPKAAITAPAALPAAPIVAPIVKPPAPVVAPPMPAARFPTTASVRPLEAGIPSVVVQPETGDITQRTRTATSGMDILDAARLAKKEDISAMAGGAAPPEIRISPEAETLLRQRAERLATEGRTPSGERRTLTPEPFTVEKVFSEFGLPTAGKVLGSLMPQTIVSSKEVPAYQAKKDAAYAQAQAFFRDRQDFQLTPENFQKVYEGYYYEGAPPKVLGSRGIAKVLEEVGTSNLPTGAIIESPIVTAGKIASTSEALLVAGAKKAGQEAGARTAERPIPVEPFADILSTQLKGGQGLMALGESTRDIAKLAGADKDTQDFAESLGSATGFIAGLLIPIDLGVGSGLAGAVKGSSGASQVAKAFDATAGETFKAGAKGAVRGFAEGTWDAYKVFTPRTGGTKAISTELAASTKRFIESKPLSDVTEEVLYLAASPKVHAAIEADRALGAASVDKSIPVNTRPVYDPSILDAALEAEFIALTGRQDWAGFKALAEKYGIDFTNTAGSRAVVSGTPPVNVSAREVQEGLRKTSAGTQTTNYFDDIATGGRSDLYYNAMIDSVDDAVKADLIAGKSIKRTDIEVAIDGFMNRVRESDVTADGSFTTRVAMGLSDQLKKRGIDISVQRILGERPKLPMGVKAPEVGKGNFVLPTAGPAFNAIKKALIIDTVKKTADNLAGRTGIIGRQVKIGDITLSPEDAKKVIQNVKDKVPALEAMKGRYNKKTGLIEVTEEEFNQLYDYFQGTFETRIVDKGGVVDISGRRAIEKSLPGTPSKRKARLMFSQAVRDTQAPLPLKPTETYSPFQTSNVIDRMNLFSQAGEAIVISADQFNTLMRGAIAIEAAPQVTARTTPQLGAIAGRLASEATPAELSYFVRTVFKPKDFSESGIGAIFVDNIKRFTQPSSQDPIVKEIVEEVNAKMGSLADDFKAKMRVQMQETQVPGANIVAGGIRAAGKTTPGVSRPVAFANVLVQEFTEGPVFRPVVIETPTPVKGKKGGGINILPSSQSTVRIGGTEVTRGQPKVGRQRLIGGETNQARRQGAFEMFRTNVAAMFGGYERAIDSISTTGRIVDLDAQAISTAEMRNLITVMIETPAFNPYFKAFEEAVMRGDNVGALNTLQRMQIDFYGYSLEQILTRKGNVPVRDVDSVMEAASIKAQAREGSDALPYRESPGRLRSVGDSWRSGSQQAMIVKPENFKELVTGTYFTKAQANALDEIITKAQQQHPDLFPSANTLQEIAYNDYQVMQNAITRQLENQAKELERAGSTAEAANIRDRLIPWFAERGSISSGARTYVQDLLIAGVEDNVTAISSTTGKGGNYLKVLADDNNRGLLQLAGASGGTPLESFYRKQLSQALDNAGVEPASVYKQNYGTNARADATALFYQTALTDIKNNLKNPFAGSLQGAAEKAATIPLLTKTAAGIKRPITNAINLKSITETMESISLATTGNKLDQVVAKNGAKVADDIAQLETVINGVLDAEISVGEKVLAKVKEQTIAGKPLRISDDVGGASDYYRKLVLEVLESGMKDVVPSINGIAKNGMLGGNGLPNMVYLMGNMLTGPSIVASQVGLGKGLKSTYAMADPDVIAAMKTVYAPAWAQTDKILFTAPDGQIYTASAIGDLIKRGGIGRSQASAELTNQLINSAIDWAGNTKLYGDKVDALGIRKAIQRNFVNINDMNVWSTLANAVDQQYRTQVLLNALKDGEQLPQAMKLARESLFDYGNLSQFEKNVVSKVFWFWTFRRNNWRSVVASLVQDPRRLKVAFSQRQGWSHIRDVGKQVFGSEEEDMDYRYAMKDYSDSRIFLSLTEDPENKKRYATYGPSIPQVQAVGDLIDYLSIPLGYAAGSAGLNVSGEQTSGLKSMAEVADLVAQQSNPWVQGLVAASIGMDLRTGRTLGDYLDPKLVWYIRQNPEMEKIFNTYVEIEAVPEDEETSSRGYFNGRQWRIKKGDKQSQKNWAMFKALMVGAGMSRTAQDYAPLAQAISPQAGYVPEAAMMTDAWRVLGVTSPQDAPTIEETQRVNRMRAASEIKDITALDAPADVRFPNKQ